MSANRNNSKKLFISTVPDPFTSKISVILKVMKYRGSLSKKEENNWGEWKNVHGR